MTDAKFYRERIAEMLRRVPPGVSSGSYQKSVAYKEVVEAAYKALKTPNSLAKLSDAHNRLAAFY